MGVRSRHDRVDRRRVLDLGGPAVLGAGGAGEPRLSVGTAGAETGLGAVTAGAETGGPGAGAGDDAEGCDGDAGDGGGGEGTAAAGGTAGAGVGVGVCAGTGAGAATGAAGGGAAGTVRAGSNPSGSTYPSSSSARRMPRWTVGTGCSGVPLQPIVPTASPSATEAPFATSIVPRWTSVTAYPSPVRIVTPRPWVGSDPANVTAPEAGARIGEPSGPATSTPRC